MRGVLWGEFPHIVYSLAGVVGFVVGVLVLVASAFGASADVVFSVVVDVLLLEVLVNALLEPLLSFT